MILEGVEIMSKKNFPKENKQKVIKSKNPINKWIMWAIVVTSFISIMGPGIAVIPFVISIIGLIKYKLIDNEYVKPLQNYYDLNEELNDLLDKIEHEEGYYKYILKDTEEKHQEKIALLEKNYDYRNSKLDEQYKKKEEELNNEFELKSKKTKVQLDEYKKALKAIKEEANGVIEEYNYSKLYPIENEDISSSEIKNKIAMLKLKEKEEQDIKSLLSDLDTDSIKYSRNQLKQIVTLFNVECEFIYSKLTVSNFETSHNKIVKNFESLNKLFSTDGVRLERSLLNIKLELLNLYNEYAIKLQQENELRKEQRAQLLEEQKVQRELDKKRDEIAKEEKHFNQEINKLMKYMQNAQELEKQLYLDKINELQNKLNILEDDKKDVENRLSNTRAGYVYVISNIGSFGENVYKIGMTRRLEPMDRVKELGDASVPFSFDVHAMIFSEDAPRLENILHGHFRDKEINKINHKKEFFRVDLNEVEKVVKEHFNDTVEFIHDPLAEQYKASIQKTLENN